ncbi:hypothetical protein B0A48_09305 [Cryoendolithus antarcticus]|uniref:Uncharacterized protein n=1 Tax=Cryoendolithus antarcticus TaxID=1507870 RepID=A0A1V8T279_9PEZI|nr:hypothetical protein B0A48_09305 [Cryoendolithus antarcticus]
MGYEQVNGNNKSVSWQMPATQYYLQYLWPHRDHKIEEYGNCTLWTYEEQHCQGKNWAWLRDVASLPKVEMTCHAPHGFKTISSARLECHDNVEKPESGDGKKGRCKPDDFDCWKLENIDHGNHD